MASMKQDDSGIYHLTVGTEVSAKYRGAFCEAQIKSVKKNVQYKVVSKKTGKSCQMSEESIKGVPKIGAVVEAQFPDQALWQECTIQSAKDRSSYTVVFDDGDERTLTRGSLCLKGDRHYAKSETLDNLPLTDPENFGTPVLTMKKNRRRRPADDEYDDDSEEHKTPEQETPKSKEKKEPESNEQQETTSEEEEDDDEKRTRWLADPLMGRVVIVEPNDKRKHWFPGLVVNPLCYPRHKELASNQIVVRSFNTGKFLRVYRSSVKVMSPATIPTKLDSMWKGIVEDAQTWQNTRVVADRWRIDIKDILNDSDDDGDEESSSDENSKTKKKNEEKKSSSNAEDDTKVKEEEKKSHDFLEVLYKFMDDRDTPINKTPVLGYKDLDLFLLYNLVQKKQGSFSISSVKEWKQIYLDLGIPKPNPAAGYNVKTAYQKYLGAYEEFCASWKHIPLPKKSLTLKTVKQSSAKDKKKQKTADTTGKDATKSQDGRKIKHKESHKATGAELNVEVKSRGRISPINGSDSPALPNQRRSGQRRRMSESSSASDATTPSISGKTEKKKQSKVNTAKKSEEKFRSPGGPDSEPDDSSRASKTDKKEAGEKRHAAKLSVNVSASKRIRRNSTSNVTILYSVGDKLKVKYGQGKTFKLYDAKVLQVKQPEGPGEGLAYYVHYTGWNARHDEWIRQGRIVGLADDKVPSSPAAGSGKARRPKTPVSGRSSYSSREDIPASPVLSYAELFDADIIKDDLPEFSIKPRFSSMLKKNLAGELAKVSASPSSENKRATSPVLVGSHQRAKRPKTPPVSEPLKAIPKAEVKQEASPVREQEKEMKKEIVEPADSKTETKLEDSKAEKTGTSQSCDVKPDVKEDKGDKGVEKVEERERSTSPSEESATSSVSEASEENSNEARANTPPIHQVRRTSGRRSKSPAYLSESWYPMASKRKKLTSSAEKSRSPTPSEKAEEPTQKPQPKPEEEEKSLVEKKTPSPTTCTSTSSPPTSDNNNSETRDSPVLISQNNTTKAAKLKAPKTRKKPLKPEPDITQKEEAKPLEDDAKTDKKDDSQSTAYDNFDEEAPSIALEKHHEMENTVTHEEENVEDSSSMVSSAKDECDKTKSEPVVPDTQMEEKVVEKKNDAPEKVSRRKIRRRKPTGSEGDTAKKEKPQEPEKTAIEDKGTPVEEIPVEKDVTEIKPQEAGDIPEVQSDAVDSTEPPSLNNPDNNAEMQLPPRSIPSHPQNAPSSSKVLLENTPPTTPEQSPTYISEDQDAELGKSSPTLDSDMLDVTEEQKDSGGNSSSSGCEQQPTDNAVKQNEMQEDEKITKEEVPSPPPAKKKRRERSRKRTTSKSRGNRRSSYTHEQDSESEEDQNQETGETNHRKRHESGGRCKPRKKRSKARPDPPSAPPPLPIEELESMSQDERIAFLQKRMAEMRKVYHQLKQEVANIDRKRKRAKRREREAAEAAAQLQASSKGGHSPFTPPKTATSKSEAPLASTVADGQAATEGKAKPEESG